MKNILRVLLLATLLSGLASLYHPPQAWAADETTAAVPSPGSASAAPAATPELPPVVKDPTAHPVDDANFVWKMYKQGALVPAIILAVFFLLTLFSRRLTILKTGKYAVWCAAALGGLAMLVERAASGATPNASMWVAALGAIVSLAAKPHLADKPPLSAVK